MRSTLKVFSVGAVLGILAAVTIYYVVEPKPEVPPTEEERAPAVLPETDAVPTSSPVTDSSPQPPIMVPTTSQQVLPDSEEKDTPTPPLVRESEPPTTTPIKKTPQQTTSLVQLDVPFLSQAPFREWKDPRQQDGCEEASVIMVMAWVNGESEISKEAGKQKILAISHYTEDTYGEYRDTSIKDTFEWILRDFYAYSGEAHVLENVTAADIKAELYEGNPVIIPANGQTLNNPYFTPPGPVVHMLVIIGYDPKTDEFITNDPGIGRGAGYRYPVQTIMNSIRDYETGYHVPIDHVEKRAIVVRK